MMLCCLLFVGSNYLLDIYVDWLLSCCFWTGCFTNAFSFLWTRFYLSFGTVWTYTFYVFFVDKK
jgi:hypothetical protein